MSCSKEWWDGSDSDEEDCTQEKLHRVFCAASDRRRGASAALLPDLLHDGRGPQGKKCRMDQTPFSWDAHVLLLTEDEFKRRYRMDFDSFTALVVLK